MTNEKESKVDYADNEDSLLHLNNLISKLPLKDKEARSIFVVGSRRWLQHNHDSDYDLIVVVANRLSLEKTFHSSLVDAKFYDIDGFRDKLFSHEFQAIVAYMTQDTRFILANDLKQEIGASFQFNNELFFKSTMERIEKNVCFLLIVVFFNIDIVVVIII
jgi:hypothetical protein